MLRTRGIWVVALFALLCNGAIGAVQPLTMGDAINKAGRQRMLTQRMIKSYALVGMNLTVDAEGQLRDAAALFSKQLDELTGFVATAEEREQIDKITLLWNDLRGEIAKQPDAARVGEMNDLAELLLNESHQLVLLLERRSGSEAGQMTNIAGRQRMLSQRIAKVYLLQTWGRDNALLTSQYEKAVDDFSKALVTLQRSQVNTPEISTALAEVEKNWKIFGISNFSKKYNTRVPSLVVRSMDKILGQMNAVTGMYARLD